MFLVWLPFNSQGVLLDGRGLPVNGVLWVGEVDKDPMSYPVSLFVDNVMVVNPVVVVNGVVPVLFTDAMAVSLLLKDKWNREVWYLNKQLFSNTVIVEIPPRDGGEPLPTDETPVNPPPSDPPLEPPAPTPPPVKVDPYYYSGVGMFYTRAVGLEPNSETWVKHRRGQSVFDSKMKFGLTIQDLVNQVINSEEILNHSQQLFNYFRDNFIRTKQDGVSGQILYDDRDYNFGGVGVDLNLNGLIYSNYEYSGDRVTVVDNIYSHKYMIDMLNYIEKRIQTRVKESVTTVDKSWQFGKVFKKQPFEYPDLIYIICAFGTQFLNPIDGDGTFGTITIVPIAKGSGKLMVFANDETTTRYTNDAVLVTARNAVGDYLSAYQSTIKFRYIDYVVRHDSTFSIWGDD